MSNAPKVITLGCRLNAYESDVMAGHARDAGVENAVFINSCAVTNEAVRQSRQAARKAKRDNPEAKIIVTGCAAQINPAEFADMPEVDLVIGNEEKMHAANLTLTPCLAAQRSRSMILCPCARRPRN